MGEITQNPKSGTVADLGMSQVREIQGIERKIARLQAVQCRKIAMLSARRESTAEAATELSLVLSVSESEARKRIELANVLANRLPRTRRAVAKGKIDLHKASKIAGPTAYLSDEQAREVDTIMAKRLADKTATQLRRATSYVVHKIDPAGAAARAMLRRADRKVVLSHRDDGMSRLLIDLPAEVASAAYARIDRMARQLRGKREPRKSDQLRADVLADVLLGRDRGRTGSPRAEIFVYVDLRTLAGLNNDPAQLAGHGAIPAWVAREVASDPSSVWRRIVTDPLTGTPVEVGRKRYRPPKVTDEFVRVRDRECRFPGCYRPSQFGDLDHATEWNRGGDTNAANLIGYCRRHHRLRQSPGWLYRLNRKTQHLTVQTPSGARFSGRPEPLHEPSPS